jgi:hypothetical protein
MQLIYCFSPEMGQPSNSFTPKVPKFSRSPSRHKPATAKEPKNYNTQTNFTVYKNHLYVFCQSDCLDIAISQKKLKIN